MDKYRGDILAQLTPAVALAKQSADLYRLTSSDNKMRLWKNTYDVADILERLQFSTHKNGECLNSTQSQNVKLSMPLHVVDCSLLLRIIFFCQRRGQL